MSRFPVINPALSLAPPEVLQTVDYSVLMQQWLTRFIELWPDYDVGALETDPAVIIAEAMSYVRLLDRVHVNDAYRALRLSLATGANLDGIALDRGVRRLLYSEAIGTTPAIYEDDESLRLRTWLAMQTWGSGSPFGIEYHAHTAGLPDVADAHVIDYPGEGHLKLVLLPPKDVDEDFDFDAVVSRVGAYVMDRRRRPGAVWIDTVEAEVITVPRSGVISVRRGASIAGTLAAAEASWRKYMATRRRISSDVPFSAVDAAIHVADVVAFHPIGQPADVVISETQAAEAGAWSVTAEVTDE